MLANLPCWTTQVVARDDMRMGDDRRIVWILGAGFSRSLGAPLLADLFSIEGLQAAITTYPDLEQDKQNLREVVNAYKYGAYGLAHATPRARLWTHAEEFLERLDLAGRNEVSARILQSWWDGPPDDSGDVVAWAKRKHALALRLMAAECCTFLEHADVHTERWKPYFRWAENLQPGDRVLTFNYDRVPDLLEQKCGQPTIITPREMRDRSVKSGALCLKLHGSVDWIREGGALLDFVAPNHQRYGHQATVVAIHCRAAEIGIATPGPAKLQMVDSGGVLEPLWNEAGRALDDADAVVFVGYRIPPTDAQTRKWLIDKLRSARKNWAERKRKESPLTAHRVAFPIHTVLGDDTNHRDSRRLQGILKAIGGIDVQQHPMFAEDFLAVFERGALFR